MIRTVASLAGIAAAAVAVIPRIIQYGKRAFVAIQRRRRREANAQAAALLRDAGSFFERPRRSRGLRQ